LTLTANTILQWPVNGNNNTPVSSIIDVTSTISGLLLEMPPAPQVSAGQSVLVRNIGSNPFYVTDNSGNVIVSISSGLAYYIWLTDNTTNNGTWTQIQFGAGTSSANAASLVGYGLDAIGSTLNTVTPVVYYYSNSTLSSNAQSQMTVWESGAGTITLPTAASVGASWFTIIKNDGTGILNIATQGTDLIDGIVSTFQLQLQESLVVVSDGTSGYASWGYGQSAVFQFVQEQINLTGQSSPYTLTSTQASYTLQNFIGTLGQNTIIVVPPTVQFYVVSNNTTLGAYTLTFSTGGSGTTVTVPQGSTVALVCDGTNVVAVSNVSNNVTTLTLNPGSVTNPSLNFTGNLSTGLYLPNSNQLGIAINGTQGALFSSAGLYVPNGISGGTF
jgi:hypothetical protein